MPRVAPFLATGIYRQTRDVAIRVGRGRAEYAKRVYGASCVRLTAADVQKCYQILSIGDLSVRLLMPLKCALGATEIVTPKKVPTFSQGGAAV